MRSTLAFSFIVALHSVLGVIIQPGNDSSIIVTSQPAECLTDCAFAILDISQSLANKTLACGVGILGDDILTNATNHTGLASVDCWCKSDEIMEALQGCMRTICPGNMTNQLRDFCGNNDFVIDTGSGTTNGAHIILLSTGLAVAALVGSLV